MSWKIVAVSFCDSVKVVLRGSDTPLNEAGFIFEVN